MITIPPDWDDSQVAKLLFDTFHDVTVSWEDYCKVRKAATDRLNHAGNDDALSRTSGLHRANLKQALRHTF